MKLLFYASAVAICICLLCLIRKYFRPLFIPLTLIGNNKVEDRGE